MTPLEQAARELAAALNILLNAKLLYRIALAAYRAAEKETHGV